MQKIQKHKNLRTVKWAQWDKTQSSAALEKSDVAEWHSGALRLTLTTADTIVANNKPTLPPIKTVLSIRRPNAASHT